MPLEHDEKKDATILWRRAKDGVFSLGTVLLNMAFPPRCTACAGPVDEQGAICQECWKQIHFISAPLCDFCGFPFEYAIGEKALCAACMQEEPPFTKARAVFRYDEFSRNLILRYKYADKTHATPAYAGWLARAAAEFIGKTDIIMPVPLHYRRLLLRRYNQASLLAYAVGKYAKVKVVPDALKRTKYTLPQSGLTRAQRNENVQGAFRVNPRFKAKLQGRSVMLVDDVMTTGATLHACCKALRKAGVAEIYVLTLARTVQAD